MNIYRHTKPGVAICPFFTWTSENIGDPDKSSKENDVNLTHCVHQNNPNRLEGNCCEKLCPLVSRPSLNTSLISRKLSRAGRSGNRKINRKFLDLNAKQLPEGEVRPGSVSCSCVECTSERENEVKAERMKENLNER